MQDSASLDHYFVSSIRCLSQRAAAALALAVFVAGARLAVGDDQPTPNSASPPNVVILLADDLGYSDLGCYGSEIDTPHLNALAEAGLRFTQFYNTARCWPTRAALLTGYYAQQVRRDAIPNVKSGSQGSRPAWAPLLPELLRSQGYRSYHSGKWHIDRLPCESGFDRSYSLEDHDRHFAPRRHLRDDRPLPAVAADSGYYSSDAIANHAIECLKEHGERHGAQPFFAYVAFTAPHFPLHAPAADVEKYRARYQAGWDALREARWQRLQQLKMAGNVLSPTERDLGPPYPFPEALQKLGTGEINRPAEWSSLTDEQRRFQADKMAVHAAMIDRMDRQIGRIVDQLKAMNALENTLLMFLADNGASAEIMVRGDGHDQQAAPGSAATFLCLGPGWSTTANTPFRRHKTWVHEGGISTPLVVHWPRGITRGGELRHSPGHVIDIVPTILELAGSKPLAEWNGSPRPPLPGRSLAAAFSSDVIIERPSLWWLHEGNRALRVNQWKLVANRNGPWELYDLTTDRAETHNLANEMPEKVRELSAQWEAELERYAAAARSAE